MARGRRRGRTPLDWVYRGREYNLETGVVMATATGTYSSIQLGISVGEANALTQVLVDSHNYMTRPGGWDAAAGVTKITPNAARQQVESLAIRGVDVRIAWQPSAWAVNNVAWCAWRVIIAEQDMATGAAILDAQYSMFGAPTGVPNDDIVSFANGRQNVAEGYLYRGFGDNGAAWQQQRMVRTKRRLEANEGLFLYLEADQSSVNMRAYLRCRTLVGGMS